MPPDSNCPMAAGWSLNLAMVVPVSFVVAKVSWTDPLTTPTFLPPKSASDAGEASFLVRMAT